jgi:predicted neutral ceramidase superfamily lipid hydrolase
MNENPVQYAVLASHRMVLLDVFLPALVVVAVITLLVRLPAILSRESSLAPGSTGLIAAFACLGLVIGILTGASMTPVVGSLLPALLTLLGALLAYMFGKESLADWRPAIPYCLIALMLSALYGIFMGGTIRGTEQRNADTQHAADLYYEKVDLEVARQKRLDSLKPPASQCAQPCKKQ